MEKQTNIENVSSKITVSIIYIYIYIAMLGDKLHLHSVETGDYEGIIKLSIHPYIYNTGYKLKSNRKYCHCQ